MGKDHKGDRRSGLFLRVQQEKDWPLPLAYASMNRKRGSFRMAAASFAVLVFCLCFTAATTADAHGGGGGHHGDGNEPAHGGIGNYEPFDWSASAAYAGFGSVKQRRYLPGPGEPYGDDESVIVVDPEREIIYQTAGAAGGASWYLANGTYLTVEVGAGAYICAYTNATYADERRLYMDSVQRIATVKAASADGATGRARTVYTGLTLDTCSCGQRTVSTMVIDASNRVRNMELIFPTQPFGQTVVQQTMFEYHLFTTKNVRSYIDPLPAACYEPHDMCQLLYPSGPFMF